MFKQVAGEWKPFQTLYAPVPQSEAYFGTSLAIDGARNMLVVGTCGAGEETAYVYQYAGGSWYFAAEVPKPDGAAWEDCNFGYSVATDRGKIVVGAPGYRTAEAPDRNSGAIVIANYDGSTCRLSRAIVNPDAPAHGAFGSSVAIEDSEVVVGAPDTPSLQDVSVLAGAVYVYRPDPMGTGLWLHKVLRSQYELSPRMGEAFGCSVDISGSTIVAGSLGPYGIEEWCAGFVSLFKRDWNDNWLPGPVIVRQNDFEDNHDQFGAAVAVDGERIVVGSPFDTVDGYGAAGSVWVFDNVMFDTLVGPDQRPTLMSNNPDWMDKLGQCVAVMGDMIVAGAPFQDEGAMADTGAAYVLQKRYWEEVVRETPVNAYVANVQSRPRVASNAGGTYVVVWQSKYQDGDWYGVFGRVYNKYGLRISNEFQANTTTKNMQYNPDVAMDADGGFVVVWESDARYPKDIVARLYDPRGIAVTGEIQVNTNTEALHREPRVATNPAGDFVVVWYSSQHNNGVFESNICGRRFGANGAPLNDQFVVSEGENCRWPDVAAAANGDFAVSWHLGVSVAESTIRLKQYNADGTPKTGAVNVPEGPLRYGGHSAVAYKDNDEIAVAWSPGEYVLCRSFGNDGNALGAQFAVEDYYISGSFPSLAFDADGRMIVACESWRTDIRVKEYRNDGKALGLSYRVNTTTAGDQQRPDVAFVDANRYVIVWQGDESHGPDTDVYAGLCPQTYAADLTGNGVVDIEDFAVFSGAWQTDEPAASVSNDAAVDLCDLSVLAEQWLVCK